MRLVYLFVITVASGYETLLLANYTYALKLFADNILDSLFDDDNSYSKLNSSQYPEMALYLAKSQIDLIISMNSSELFINPEIAAAINRNTRRIRRIRSNILYYNIYRAPRNSGGRTRSITLIILDALYKYLLEKPKLY